MLQKADNLVLALYEGCVKLGGETTFFSGEALQVPLMLPLELPNFVPELVLDAVGGAREG